MISLDVERRRADVPRLDPHVVRVSAYGGGSLGVLKRDVSLCRRCARATHISFLTGTYRPRDPTDVDPDPTAVDLAHAGDGGPRLLDVPVPHSDHRLADAVAVCEIEQREVGVGAAGVADQVARGVPERALERAATEARVRPRLDPDRDVPPARSEVLGEVFHGVGLLLGRAVAESFRDDHGHLVVTRSTAVTANPSAVNASTRVPTVAGSSTSGP